MKDETIFTLLEQLLKMSETGIHFAKDEYNRERYHALKQIAEQLYTQVPGFSKTRIEPYDEKGYITPKVGVNAYIENDKGQVLLEKRTDDKCWGIPGGWAEVGFTAEENIQREIKEETQLEIKVKRLLDVISRKPSGRYPFSSYHLIFECEIVSGTIKKSHESEDIAWKKIEEIDHWHFDHRQWMDRIRRRLQSL